MKKSNIFLIASFIMMICSFIVIAYIVGYIHGVDEKIEKTVNSYKYEKE